MIAFRCPQCTQKFEVREEFAGRQSRCPACKHALVVPAPAAVRAAVPDRIDGATSSLARAGLDPSLTLPIPSSAQSEDGPGQRSVAELLARNRATSERYLIEGEIARGGMGAVMRAVDCDIRREVAIKYLLDQTDPKRKLRFVEEAQITGQLEHPNIVPIHELGIDAHKRLFFSMKMVRGRSLDQVIAELRTEPRRAEREYPLAAGLLNILVNVCHALAYAHSRNVVHRDLKPANIMLGDFGEVYIMDWGLARVIGPVPAAPVAKLAPLVAAPVATIVMGPAVAAPAAVPLAATVALPVPALATVPVATPTPLPIAPLSISSSSITALHNTKVMTSRNPDADLTQDGAVLGTPAYMPPEQAVGHMNAVDQRSDVYALGAILYEMLTLEPPVDREGDYLAVLMRVSQGEIPSPEQRAPDRARKGKVPRELAAVAMKALALRPADRYPSADELRRDIERFQEGRSVSAKGDSAVEMTWKLVKRNKGASVGVGLAFAAVLLGLGLSFRSWLKAESAYAAYRKEQESKRAQAQQAVPAFVAAARMSVERRNYGDALAQVSVALDYEPRDGDARLLRSQVHIVRRDFDAARTDLNEYLRLVPDDAQARKLSELCSRRNPEEPGTLLAFAQVFNDQKAPALADGLLTKYGPDSIAARRQLLGVYQKRVEKAWPGMGQRMGLDDNGVYFLNISGNERVTDLEPLADIPLSTLIMEGCRVRDLSPLRSMPLATLNMWGCPVSDLTPLQGLRLRSLNLNRTQVRDLSPLRGMPLQSLVMGQLGEVRDLSPLEGMPLGYLDLWHCRQISDLTPLHGLPLTRLGLSGCQVHDLTPLRGMKLGWLNIDGCPVQDLTPLRGMPLASLSMMQCNQIIYLAPLRGMPLTTLSIFGCTQVRDLSPLEEMKLTSFDMRHCSQVRDLAPLKTMKPTSLDLLGCSQVRDLAPLRNMPLNSLGLEGCTSVVDLAPLAGLRLTSLNLSGCRLVEDIRPLRGMPLTALTLNGCAIRDLGALRGMPLTTLQVAGCPALQDLSGIAGMNLTSLDMMECPKAQDVAPLAETALIDLRMTPPYVSSGMDRLRRLKTLKSISVGFDRYAPEDFWRRYEAGQFKK